MIAPNYPQAIADIFRGIRMYPMWGRMGWAEIRRRYRRTIFGPFWTSISLAIFALSMGLVWANLWRIDPHTYLPFLTSGLVVWMLLTSFMTEGCVVFVANEGLIKQLPVNFTVLICAVVWRNLVVFGHNMLVYVLIYIYSGAEFTSAMLLVFPGLIILCLNGLWMAMTLGILCARYRDVQQIVSSLIQIAMFVTPIFWIPTQLSGKAAYLVDFNVLYHLIAVVREPLLGQAPTAWTWTVVLTVTLLGWWATLFIFSRFRRRLAYWL